MPGQDMEVIELQLSILQDHHALADLDRQKILSDLETLKKKDPNLFKEYSESIAKGLPGVTAGVIGAIKAGKSGDPLAISIASLNIFSGVVTMAVPLLGPIGPLVAALSGMISTILAEFLPKPPSLKDEITSVFNKFLADEKRRALEAASDQIWILADTIQNHTREYKPLNLRDGAQVQAIDEVWAWLLQEDTQALPQWGEMLEKVCQLFTQLLRCVTLEVNLPSTKEGVTKTEPIAYLPARLELFLNKLQRIRIVAQKRGTFWDLGATRANDYTERGYVYTTDSIIEPIKWTGLSGPSRIMVATLNHGQEGEQTPVMTLLTLESTGSAWLNTPLPDSGVYNRDHPFLRSARTYGVTGKWPVGSGVNQLGSDNSSYPLDGCYDIYAIPADERCPGGVYFYTANGSDIRGYRLDSKGKVTFAWSSPIAEGRTAGTIRVVNNPTGFADDPDENPKKDPLVLSSVGALLYAGCEAPVNSANGMDILVMSWESKGGVKERYIKSPWRNFRGIGVDQGYLWVYRAGVVACATHTGIRKATEENRPIPWMISDIPYGIWMGFGDDQPKLSGLLDLSPCDDGTIFVSLLNGEWGTNAFQKNDFHLLMMTPRIDRKARSMYLGEKTDVIAVGGTGFRVQKQPIFCWSMLQKQIEVLKEQVGDGHHKMD